MIECVRTIKQTLSISFWANDENTANAAFDYVWEKWFKHDCDELEFENYETVDEGVYAHWKCTAVRDCDYIPATEIQPEDVDYSRLIETDEPKDWIKCFLVANNLDDSDIADIFVDEEIEEE